MSENTNAVSPMSYERCMQLLNDCIDNVGVGENLITQIEELVNIGFTTDELVRYFNFDQDDIDRYLSGEEDEDDE